MNTGYWLPQGSILHEKYSIKKGLGQGGFAITYLAYDTMLQQNVAIKEYFPVRYAKRLSSHLSNVGNENSLTEEMVSFQLSATSMVYPQPGQEENYLKGMQNFLGEARLLFVKFDIEGIAFTIGSNNLYASASLIFPFNYQRQAWFIRNPVRKKII